MANTYDYKWHASGQPEPVNLPKREKFFARLVFADNYFWVLFFAAFDFIFLVPAYFFLKWKMFSSHVKIEGRFGLSVSPVEGRNDEILKMLDELGVERVNVRVYFSDKENLSQYDDLMKKLIRAKKLHAITLVQNREAVKIVSSWQKFVKDVVSRYGNSCKNFIVCVAPNRIKWGVWHYYEYVKLFHRATGQKRFWKEVNGFDVQFVGPSVIDFEWLFANAILHGIKPDFVSHNLYVDVRGKPEDGMMGFDVAGKVCFLKAMTSMSEGFKIPLWLTEVNWPLKNQEGFAPAAGPVCVTEEQYADYMVRYMILCAATGYVEQIFWWQLVARGYGLVDDTDGKWRKRPAYFALKMLNEQLKGCTFLKNLSADGMYKFLFSRDARDQIMVLWVKDGTRKIKTPEGSFLVVTRDGKEEKISAGQDITVSESPVYVHIKT